MMFVLGRDGQNRRRTAAAGAVAGRHCGVVGRNALFFVCASIFVFSTFLTTTTTITTMVVVVQAAHSRRRANTRQDSRQPTYDREITTFNPQGRLEQVEYGMVAADRGGPVAVLKHTQHNNDSRRHDNSIYMMLEDSLQKVHRIDDNKFLITTGLSGDGRLLARLVRTMCQQHWLDYGEVATCREAVAMAAGECHAMTRTAGARPLGCHAILVGVEPAEDEEEGENTAEEARLVVRIFQCDPGGGMEECQHCVAAGRGKEKLYQEMQKLVQEQQKNDKREVDDDDSAAVAQKLTNIMLRLQQQEGRSSNKDSAAVASKLDLWRIQPEKGRRGNMLATVYTQVEKQVDWKGVLSKQ